MNQRKDIYIKTSTLIRHLSSETSSKSKGALPASVLDFVDFILSGRINLIAEFRSHM